MTETMQISDEKRYTLYVQYVKPHKHVHKAFTNEQIINGLRQSRGLKIH